MEGTEKIGQTFLRREQWHNKRQQTQGEALEIPVRHEGKRFSPWGWSDTGTGRPKRLWLSIHGSTGHSPLQPGLTGPALSRGWPRWPPEVPSNWITPWFFEYYLPLTMAITLRNIIMLYILFIFPPKYPSINLNAGNTSLCYSNNVITHHQQPAPRAIILYMAI